jgi:hypothetical protein
LVTNKISATLWAYGAQQNQEPCQTEVANPSHHHHSTASYCSMIIENEHNPTGNSQKYQKITKNKKKSD